MVHAYTIGSPKDEPDLGQAERNLSKLLKKFGYAADAWTESSPLVIYEVEYEKSGGYIVSFRGKVIGKYYGDFEKKWPNNRIYYKTRTKLYTVSKEGRLTEIRRK